MLRLSRLGMERVLNGSGTEARLLSLYLCLCLCLSVFAVMVMSALIALCLCASERVWWEAGRCGCVRVRVWVEWWRRGRWGREGLVMTRGASVKATVGGDRRWSEGGP